MKMIPSIVGWLMVLLAFGLYVFGLGYAIYHSFNGSAANGQLSFPEPLDLMLSSLSAIFLTNLGAVLGIAVANPQTALARNVLPQRAKDANPAADDAQMELREKIQYWAMIVFLIGMVACFVAWAFRGFSSAPDKVLSVIPQQAKMLIGVMSAYMAFVLGRKQN
jgi:hypothetical protein